MFCEFLIKDPTEKHFTDYAYDAEKERYVHPLKLKRWGATHFP